jgi:tetratricopeptide (TPR) repeat protein
MNFVKQFLGSLWSCKAAFLVLCAVLACFHSLHAQPEQVAKAEAVFAEALLLSSHFEAEHETEVTAKFDEAATLFRNAGNGKRAGEVDLQHGKYLKNLGIRDLNADKLTTAQSYFDKALSKLRPLAAHLELAYVYHNIGFIAAKSEKYDEAKKVYGSARTEYAIAGDRDGEATVLRNLGVIHYNQQNYALARASFASALNIRIAMRQLEAQALLQTDLGDCERQLKRWLGAASRYELALATYRKAKSRKGEAEAHVRLGELYNLQFKYAPAAKNLAAAQQIYTEIEDWQDLAETVEKLGSLHLAYSKYAEAERSLRLASEMYKILGQKNNEGTVSLDLAVALKSQNRTEEARAVIDRARICFKEGDSLLGDAYALIIDADFLSYLNKHDEALANIKSAEKMFQENPGSGSGKFRIARAYSDYYYYLSNYGETIRYGQIALAEAEKDGHDYRIASSLLNLTNAYSALGQNQRSIALLQRTHVIARKIGSRYLESIVLSNIGYDYFLIKKLPQAESNFRRAIAIMHADD